MAAAALKPTRSQRFSEALDADLTRPRAFALLAILYLLLRIPFLTYGYGTDPDSWRVALTDHYLLRHGLYFPSRLPGYPLHEFAVAPLVPLGPVATNLETALAALVGVYLFGRIVNHLKLPQPALLTVGFAFTPLLVINSVSTMDYMWTLTCILAAYYSALRGWILWAGVAVGTAIGFRLPAAIIWLPIAYLLIRERKQSGLIPLSLAAVGVALIARAPAVAVYGPRVFRFYDASVNYQSVARLLAKEGLGVIGAAAVLIGSACSLRRFKALPGDLRDDPQVGAWVIMALVTLLVFFRLPHKVGYLIPIFPFGYFLMARYFSRSMVAAAVVAILCSGLIDVTIHEGPLNVASLRHAGIGKGLLLSNVETMRNQSDFVREVLAAQVPDHSIVMVGFVYPQLAVRTWNNFDVGILQKDYDAISMLSDRGETVDTNRDIHYVWLLTFDQFMSLRSRGYNFFLVPDAAGGTAALYKYRPTLLGATYLRLDRAVPSLGKQPTGR